MSRIIKTSTPGKERAQLSKAIVITIREFMRKDQVDQGTRDMVAFIILALREIASGIDKSVAAWEKRGYWVKADKYRLEWRWTGETANDLAQAFEKENWTRISDILAETMGKFMSIKVSDRHRMGKPWLGAESKFQQEETGQSYR